MNFLSYISFFSTHLFISSLCTGLVLSSIIYFTYSPISFISIIANIYTNIMYLYTIIEYNIEKVKKNYDIYICNNETNNKVQVIDYCHIFIRNNDIVNIIDDYDIHLIEIDNNVYVGQTITDYNTLKKSNIKFISFDVNFQDGDKHIMYSIDLCKKSGNYLQIGNIIDKYVIWYLVKKQYGVCYYDKSYSINVIDTNVNMFILTKENTMEFGEETYIIK